MTFQKLVIMVLASIMLVVLAFTLIPAYAHHGHHRNPGHPKLRKAVCILLAHEQDDAAELPEIPDIGCR